jgi:hypothetical protein
MFYLLTLQRENVQKFMAHNKSDKSKIPTINQLFKLNVKTDVWAGSCDIE